MSRVARRVESKRDAVASGAVARNLRAMPSVPRSVRVTKRAIDVVGAIVLLVLCAPVLLLVAVLIRLDSRGPILYRQRRCGPLVDVNRGKVECEEFYLYKF